MNDAAGSLDGERCVPWSGTADSQTVSDTPPVRPCGVWPERLGSGTADSQTVSDTPPARFMLHCSGI